MEGVNGAETPADALAGILRLQPGGGWGKVGALTVKVGRCRSRKQSDASNNHESSCRHQPAPVTSRPPGRADLPLLPGWCRQDGLEVPVSKSYWQKLQDPRWQKRRLEILNGAGFKCEDCGSEKETLSIHHSYYEKGLEPWEYPGEALLCLCEECHTARASSERAVLRELHFCRSAENIGLLADVLNMARRTHGMKFKKVLDAIYELSNAENAKPLVEP